MALEGVSSYGFQAFAGGLGAVKLRASTSSTVAPIESSVAGKSDSKLPSAIGTSPFASIKASPLGPEKTKLGPDLPPLGEEPEKKGPEIRERDEKLANYYIPPLSLTRNLEQLNDQIRIQFLPLEAFKSYSQAITRAVTGGAPVIGGVSDVFA